MKIFRLTSNDCGGFQKAKGHLDTQMYPECEGTPCDRDVVKLHRKKKQKKKKAKSSCKICDILSKGDCK